MDRREAIQKIEAIIDNGQDYGYWTDAQRKALNLAIEALEREIEYGQMVVDFTKGETMKSDEWKYDTTCDAESATTTDCISRADIEYHTQLEARGNGQYEEVEVAYKSDIDNLPPVNQKQITGKLENAEIATSEGDESTMGQPKSKLKNPCDSLLTDDSDECKEQKSKLDCISRQQAIEVVHKYFVDAIDKTPHEIDEGGDEIYTDTKAVNELLKHNKHISKAIKELPPVTPTERTGEWIKNDDFTCSACGYHMIVGGGAYNFCPNCGAKMGGDE